MGSRCSKLKAEKRTSRFKVKIHRLKALRRSHLLKKSLFSLNQDVNQHIAHLRNNAGQTNSRHLNVSLRAQYELKSQINPKALKI